MEIRKLEDFTESYAKMLRELYGLYGSESNDTDCNESLSEIIFLIIDVIDASHNILMRYIGPLIDLDESENLSSEKDTASERSECTILEKEILSDDVKVIVQDNSTPQDNSNEMLHEKKCNMINYEITMHEFKAKKDKTVLSRHKYQTKQWSMWVKS